MKMKNRHNINFNFTTIMKRVLFSVILLLAAGFTFAQEKTVKEAKSIANEVNPDFNKAEQLINQALTNPETKDNADTWDVAGFIQKRINEKQMENAYLRKPYDTLKVYNSALNMCKYYLKCDELAQVPNEKGKIKNKYRKPNAAAIVAERPNLINGGIQYYNLEKNKEALDFFGTYIEIAQNPMFEKENFLQTDTLLAQIAYYASLAAAKMEDYPSVLKYAPYAQNDKEVGQYAPKIDQISIDPQKIGDVVGKQGCVINKIIEETGVKIDISDDGSVSVCGTDKDMIARAIEIIKSIVTDIEPGAVMKGKVVRIMNFGAFVELAPNKDGMVHISKLSDKRVEKVEDAVNIGDEVTVRVLEVDKMGRINLSMKPGDMDPNVDVSTLDSGRRDSDRRDGGRRDSGRRDGGRRDSDRRDSDRRNS